MTYCPRSGSSAQHERGIWTWIGLVWGGIFGKITGGRTRADGNGCIGNGPESRTDGERVAGARRRGPLAGAGSGFASAAVLAAALFAVLSGLTAVPAQAQTPETLVSNTGQSVSTNRLSVGKSNNRQIRRAQSFITGSAVGGYTLTSVVVPIHKINSSAQMQVRIHAADANNALNPGTRLYNLTNPTNLNSGGDNTFTAPENATLDEETTYFVVFRNGSSNADRTYVLAPTLTDDEDEGAAEDWSIGDTNRVRDEIDSWITAAVGGASSLRFQIIGTFNNDPPDFGADTATRSVTEEMPVNVIVGAPVTATDLEGAAVTYTLEGTDSDNFRIDASSGQIRTRTELDYETQESHSVTVRATDATGGTATIAVTINVIDIDEQTRVTGLEAMARARGAVFLSWNVPVNAAMVTGYRIETSTDGTNFTVVAADHDATQYIHNTGFPAGRLLYYRVIANLGTFERGDPSRLATVTTEDDPAVALIPSSVSVTEGGSATYTVVLTSQPSSAVTVTNVSGSSDVRVSPASLTFGPDTWDVPQQVTVRAMHDPDNSNEEVTVTHSASNYEAGRMLITVLDDDDSLVGEFYYTYELGAVPGFHFGESFKVRVRFNRRMRFLSDVMELVGPDRGIRVTGGTVESARFWNSRARRELFLTVRPSSGTSDVTLTLEPLPCDATGALCGEYPNQVGLVGQIGHTVRAVTVRPPEPQDVQVATVQEDGGEFLNVSMAATHEATGSRTQWKKHDQEWSEAREHSRTVEWRAAVAPGDRHSAVTARVEHNVPYDVRVRWESSNGDGPWAYGTRPGTPRERWEESIKWYQNTDASNNVSGAEVRIKYDRELDHETHFNFYGVWPFSVAYSASRLLGRSVTSIKIIDTTDDGTYNPRTIRLALRSVGRGIGTQGAEYPSPLPDEQVYVTYNSNVKPPRPPLRDTAGNPAPYFTSLLATFVQGPPPAEIRRPSSRPVSAKLLSSGHSIDVAFNWILSRKRTPSTSRFVVRVDGARRSVIKMEWKDSGVRLSVSPDIRRGRTVTLGYKQPNDAPMNRALRDLAGHLVDSFADFAVTNNSTRSASSGGIGPAPVSAAVQTSGESIVLTMDEAIDRSITPSASHFTVTIDGNDHTPSSVQVHGTDSYSINLATTISAGQQVVISYDDPPGNNSSGIMQDTGGNDAPDFVNFPVTRASQLRTAQEQVLSDLSELSVADAQATEGTDQTLDFVVTLNPASTTEVTVDYATADGTATAGADYTETSETLRFLAGETTKTVSVPIIDDSVEDDAETLLLTLFNGVGARITDAEATGTIRNTETLTAEFHNFSVTTHDGSAAFTFELRFSENWMTGLGFATIRDHAFTVTKGQVTNVRRMKAGNNQRWRITITPAGDDAVTITLPATTDCSATGAICIGTRPLSAAVEETVPGPAPVTDQTEEDPLTAEFRDMSVTSHDGSTAFTFELRFSENVTNLSSATLRDHAFTVTNGQVTNVRQLDAGNNQRWEITITPAGNDDVTIALPATTDCSATGAICIGTRPLSAAVSKTVPGPEEPQTQAALTAAFRDFSVTTHDGSTAFTFELRFSENWTSGLSYALLRDHAFTVTNGQVTNVRRLAAGNNQRWEITITPAGNDDITIALPATTDCSATGAICIGTRPLSAAVSKTVPGPEEPQTQAALTAAFRDFSVTTHDGSTAFTFELRFSENWTSGLSYALLRDHAFTVTNGQVTRARRLAAGNNQRWKISVEPAGNDDVTIALPATTDCSATGAICIGDRPLSAAVSKTVPGPAAGKLALADSTLLLQNAPNPFNSQTVISWVLRKSGPTRLDVFAVTGQRVAVLHQGPQQAGMHRLYWEARDEKGHPLASGIYIYRLVTAEGVLTQKLILLR